MKVMRNDDFEIVLQFISNSLRLRAAERRGAAPRSSVILASITNNPNRL
jgi:hypothetical protein